MVLCRDVMVLFGWCCEESAIQHKGIVKAWYGDVVCW